MVDYKPRRITKLPARYNMPKQGSKTSKTRLEEFQKTYPGVDVEIEPKPSDKAKKDNTRD